MRTAGMAIGLILAASGCTKDKKDSLPPSPVPPPAAAVPLPTADTPEAWLAHAEDWLRNARLSGNSNDFVEAEKAAAKAETLGAKNAAGVRAFTLIHRQKFEEARQVAEAALAQAPEDLRALAALADAQLELGRVEESGKTVQTMVDLRPNLPSYGRASWIRWLMGDPVGAKKLAISALDAGRDKRDAEARAWTYCQTASYFWHEGDFEGAEAGYDQALALVPAYAPALVGKARAALSRGDAARALPLVNAAFAKVPTVPSAILRARVMDVLKDPKAAEAWAAAEAIDVGYGAGLVLALRNERIDEAVAKLTAARTLRPSIDVLDAHGWALFRAGRLEEAEEAAAGAARFGTREARLWYHLGAILLARGNAAGRGWVERALKLNPAWDPAEVAAAKRLVGP